MRWIILKILQYYNLRVLYQEKVNFVKSQPQTVNSEHKSKYAIKEKPKNQQELVYTLTWSTLLTSTWQNGEDRVRKDKERQTEGKNGSEWLSQGLSIQVKRSCSSPLPWIRMLFQANQPMGSCHGGTDKRPCDRLSAEKET